MEHFLQDRLTEILGSDSSAQRVATLQETAALLRSDQNITHRDVMRLLGGLTLKGRAQRIANAMNAYRGELPIDPMLAAKFLRREPALILRHPDFMGNFIAHCPGGTERSAFAFSIEGVDRELPMLQRPYINKTKALEKHSSEFLNGTIYRFWRAIDASLCESGVRLDDVDDANLQYATARSKYYDALYRAEDLSRQRGKENAPPGLEERIASAEGARKATEDETGPIGDRLRLLTVGAWAIMLLEKNYNAADLRD